MTKDVPAGPFTVAEIHAKLANRETTWEVMACRMGGSDWKPLIQTAGFGPIALDLPENESEPRSNPSPAGVSNQAVVDSGRPVSTATTSRAELPATGPSVARIIAVVLSLGVLGYLGYEWIRPLSALETADRFFAAKSADEACRYATLNLHPAIRAMSASTIPDDPNDQFELTGEVDAPADVGGKVVGFRMHFYDRTAKKRVQVDGFLHLLRVSEWKIEDIFFSAYDHTTLSEPVSWALNYREILAGQPTSISYPGAKSSGNDIRTAGVVGLARGLAAKAGPTLAKGGKVVGIVLLGALVAAAAAARARWNRRTPAMGQQH